MIAFVLDVVAGKHHAFPVLTKPENGLADFLYMNY